MSKVVIGDSRKSKVRMGGLVRKRGRSSYEEVDEQVHFLKRSRVEETVAGERTRFGTVRKRKNSYESSDSESSNDGSQHFPARSANTFTSADAEVTFKRRVDESKPQTVKVKAMLPAVGQKSAANRKDVKKADDEVDDRETNRRSPNGFLLPDPLPKGEVLSDSLKQEWVLGRAIGVGGFGELYLASCKSKGKLSPENFVIKIEPHSNGPLFVEVHFYIRATKLDNLSKYKSKHNIKHLGVPRYIASGTHAKKGQQYRFLVMERFGSDLQRILDNSEGGRFTDKTVCEVALQVLDSLEYIHQQGYVHKDVKASNLLVGLGVEGQHKVHLVDYGLCSRYTVGGIHKQYLHDLRWAHEGTLEYTSRDSHIGCSSRRGDVEVLLYNLIEWWGGSLPWDRDFATPEIAKSAKFRAFANPHKFLRHCFRRKTGSYPLLLNKMMRYIGTLRFEEEPDYEFLRGIIRQEMRDLGCVHDGRLEFRLGQPPGVQETEGENLLYLRPPSENERVSEVFDKLCVSSRSWERARENLWAQRDLESLDNPTQAMIDVQTLIKEKDKSGGRKRQKSGGNYLGDGPENTPAMLEVMRRLKLRQLEGDTEDDKSASLLPTTLLRMSPIPAEVVAPVLVPSLRSRRENISLEKLSLSAPETVTPEKMSPPSKSGTKKPRELMRLDSFLSEPDSSSRRRTRSADVTDHEVARNLRSAFRFGLGNMRSLIRQVSDSFTSMF